MRKRLFRCLGQNCDRKEQCKRYIQEPDYIVGTTDYSALMYNNGYQCCAANNYSKYIEKKNE